MYSLYNTTTNRVSILSLGIIIEANDFCELNESIKSYFSENPDSIEEIDNGSVIISKSEQDNPPLPANILTISEGYSVLSGKVKAIDTEFDDSVISVGATETQTAIEKVYAIARNATSNGNIDGGRPNTNYGGSTLLYGGRPNSFGE